MNSLDQLQPVAGMCPVGELRVVPDTESFRAFPYAPSSGGALCDQLSGGALCDQLSGGVLCDQLDLAGEPTAVCQRSLLKWMAARLAERGLL